LNFFAKQGKTTIVRTTAKATIRSVFGTAQRRGESNREQIMDVAKILNELRLERERIDEAILTLERLAQGAGKRRGRPPAWLAEIRKKTPKAPQAKPSKAATA
jgi:hypothetical protein